VPAGYPGHGCSSGGVPFLHPQFGEFRPRHWSHGRPAISAPAVHLNNQV
jgi:hypothetical protein